MEARPRIWPSGFRCRAATHSQDCRDADETLVVVGGGPAGVYGAIRAKALCPSLRVVVLEKTQFLTKVKISGGGRCNVTTGRFVDPLALSEQYPRGHKELRGMYFRQHGPLETAAWFEDHGVSLKTEEDGRIFPTTDDSATVVNCLLNEARRIGVNLLSRVLVRDISTTRDGRFCIQTRGRAEAETRSRFLLLATGSAREGYALAEKLGHSLVKPMPSLFSFKISDPDLHGLAGVSFEHVVVELELPSQQKRQSRFKFTQEGALLITHWGLSGPAVLRLSAWAARELFLLNYKGILKVDFTPALSTKEVSEIFVKQRLHSARRKLDSGAPEGVAIVRRFWRYLLKRQGFNSELVWSELSNQAIQDLVMLLKNCPFEISGRGEYKDEFVTAGGIPLDEVNLKTMESKKCSRLYLAGELINVDGVTGGFNFQNAWTGGYIAGSSIASSFQEVGVLRSSRDKSP